jgi:pyruvate-formate lyase-activating enzyme
MGVYKWQEMGLDYPLEGVPSPDKQSMKEVKDVFRRHGFKVNLD